MRASLLRQNTRPAARKAWLPFTLSGSGRNEFVQVGAVTDHAEGAPGHDFV